MVRSFSLIAAAWLLGCTAPSTPAEIVVAHEQAAEPGVSEPGASEPGVSEPESSAPPVVSAPPLAREPEPSTPEPSTPEPPREHAPVVGAAHPKLSVRVEDVGEAWPSIDISAVEVPAIDVDTGTMVIPQLQILQLTPITGWWKVSWLDAHGSESSLPVVEASDNPPTRSELRRRVDEINDKLHASRWRGMEELAVDLRDGYLDPDEPVAARRVQALVQHGELILRIPGVRVLERHPLQGRPELYRLYADRESGNVLAVFMTCTGEDCTCDPEFTARILHFGPETFAAIDQRPCSACRPEFDFTFDAPWG